MAGRGFSMLVAVLVTALIGAHSASADPGPGAWVVESSTSALTDAKGYTATLQSEGVVLNQIAQPAHASLVVRCADGNLAVYFAWPQIVSRQGDSAFLHVPQTLVLFRKDGAKIDADWWDISDSGDGAGKFSTRYAAPLLNKLSGSQKFVVRIAGTQSTQDAVFIVTGIDEVAAAARQACGVPAR